VALQHPGAVPVNAISAVIVIVVRVWCSVQGMMQRSVPCCGSTAGLAWPARQSPCGGLVRQHIDMLLMHMTQGSCNACGLPGMVLIAGA
jgi:hypothetical protein